MASSNRPRVFLDVNIGEQPAGRLTIELFTDKTPKTCENFRQLCTGEHNGMSYAKAPFHRVIDEFMIQGGDIANGDGTGTESIYDGEFDDENLHWREMDAAGLVCSANRGKDTNGSQFFITLEPCSHLNGKHTIFGHLVSGQQTLERISKLDVDQDDRPHEPVLVAKCGELEKKRKRASPVREARAAPESTDRGRRRKSDNINSDEEMEDTPEPQKNRRGRRQSDNIIDEGLRGRPRQRSHSRSRSRAMSTTGEESEGHSPGSSKHKRKRSPSPSRRPDGGREDDDYERRRQRSLPNQYNAAKQKMDRGDEDRYRPSPRRDNYQHAGRRRDENRGQREYDQYQQSRGGRRGRYEDNNRLGNDSDGRLGGCDDGTNPPVKFKGRGVMKFREPGRL